MTAERALGIAILAAIALFVVIQVAERI